MHYTSEELHGRNRCRPSLSAGIKCEQADRAGLYAHVSRVTNDSQVIIYNTFKTEEKSLNALALELCLFAFVVRLISLITQNKKLWRIKTAIEQNYQK